MHTSLKLQRQPVSTAGSLLSDLSKTQHELLIRTVATTANVLHILLPPIVSTPAPHCCSTGDYGWDPLGLGADPTALKWCVRTVARSPAPSPSPPARSLAHWTPWAGHPAPGLLSSDPRVNRT